MDALAILQSAPVQEVLRRHGLRAAYLFGSRAKGRSTEHSDVDLAVLFPSSGNAAGRFEAVVSLELELKRLFPVDLDIVSLNDASPLLEFEAAIRGLPVFTHHPDDVARYEIAVRRRYEDYCHIHDIWMRGLRKRLGVR